MNREEMWAALVARDRAADGAFYYSVKTTGVYCRPSCASRLSRRENVAFHLTQQDAERAGFRPCKRCKPNEAGLAARHAALVARACETIAAAEAMPSLEALATEAGMSRYHFHRVFRAVAGVTPKAYAAARRAQRVREELPRAESVTDAIYGAGFNSSGRFYAQSAELLGMTPAAFRAGGAETEIRFATAPCWLGEILVAATDKGICAILLGDDAGALAAELKERFPRARLTEATADFARTVEDVVRFVESPQLGLELPLDVRGTVFQQRVWRELRAIPAGERASYSEIAERIGAPQSTRAVAYACASNALAVAIPCHRVVRQDGALSGYRWGVERKRALLEREMKV
jgi:AraC family transcriptional regulator of adaptative response/methylated-DNA-[protein]-cysteine methyltransferase